MPPRSVSTNQQMREKSRERILAAALEVFAAKGYEAASISEITARAGVSRGLVSYYFVNKRRLAISLMLQPGTHPVFAEVETAKNTRLTEVENAIRAVFADRGATDPAVEEMLLRATLEGITVKLAIYPETFPTEAIRHRLHAAYDLRPRSRSTPRKSTVSALDRSGGSSPTGGVVAVGH